MNPTILDSTVIGPRSLVYYRIGSSLANGVFTTLVKDNHGANVAVISWQQSRPVLEFRGLPGRQKVREWLPMSSDQR
jgi:hypothetical protein